MNENYLKSLKKNMIKNVDRKYNVKRFTYKKETYELVYNATKGFKLFKV